MNEKIFYINNEYRIEASKKNAEILNLIYNGKESKGEDWKINSYDKENYIDILDEYEFIKGISEPSRPHQPKLKVVADPEKQAVEQKKYDRSMEFYVKAMELFRERLAKYNETRKEIREIFAEMGYVF